MKALADISALIGVAVAFLSLSLAVWAIKKRPEYEARRKAEMRVAELERDLSRRREPPYLQDEILSPEARAELEKAVAAFRADLVKKALRAKKEGPGDIVSAHNVKTAAADQSRRIQAARFVGMASNGILGAALGALVSLLFDPPPGGLKVSILVLLATLVMIGTVGAAWQLTRDD